MTNFKAITFIFTTVISSIFAQTNLSGNIGGMTLEKSGNPFIVSANITIPAGKKVTILEGCVFLFKPFTGITVEGNLNVAGTVEQPVIFTTFNDSSHNSAATQPPDPFDWNGIIISSRARQVTLTHFIIQYSVYGVKSQTYDLLITQGIFTNNGQFHFTINDEIQPVSDSTPYNYSRENEPAPPPVKKKTTVRWKRPVAIGAGVAGVAGLSVMGYFLHQKNIYRTLYNASTYQPDMDTYIADEETAQSYAAVSGSAGGAALAAGVVLWTVDLRERKKVTAAFYPIFGETVGIVAAIKF